MKTYDEIQDIELSTWNIADPAVRKEKQQRERIRYPYIRKLMGLESLDTSQMTVYDIGAGPLGGVSTVIPAKKIVRVDPLADRYKEAYDLESGYLARKAEDLNETLADADLVVVTNALDHFEDPNHFLKDLVEFGKGGMYFAHAHAVNNAITHPHEAHQWNVCPQFMKTALEFDFELVWNYDYDHDGARYGWVNYQGVVGQPAFYQLWRKVTGYKQ